MSAAAPISVVVPTVGRPSLGACVASLQRCDPPPAEIVLVLQGADPDPTTRRIGGGPVPVQLVTDAGEGTARATNLGLRTARHGVVAVTHDDCTVDASWVGEAAQLARRHPAAVLTGQVRPDGDPDRVPSCKTDPHPADYSGTLDPGVLYPNNMVLPREAVMALGGFDERFGRRTPAEDCDFAYRWLRAGNPLRYEPSMVVHHADWRDDHQLAELYDRYAFGLGAVYGKHLRARDARVLRFVARDLRTAGGVVADRVRGRPEPADWRQGLPRAWLAGLRYGWRELPPTEVS